MRDAVDEKIYLLTRKLFAVSFFSDNVLGSQYNVSVIRQQHYGLSCHG
jgi:hypothetical protein